MESSASWNWCISQVVGGSRALGVLGLVPTHWCAELDSGASCCRALRGSWASSCLLVFGAGSPWWTRSCPGVAVGSGGLKATYLLVGVAFPPPD